MKNRNHVNLHVGKAFDKNLDLFMIKKKNKALISSRKRNSYSNCKENIIFNITLNYRRLNTFSLRSGIRQKPRIFALTVLTHILLESSLSTVKKSELKSSENDRDHSNSKKIACV